MASAFIKQVTVYADVRSAAQLKAIRTIAQQLCPTNCRVIDVASLLARSADATATATATVTAATPSLAFMKHWEAENADTVAYVRNEVDLFSQFECFVTSAQTARSGEVAYALYRRQMPVLALRRADDDEGSAEDDISNNKVGPSSSFSSPSVFAAPSAPVTALESFLYHERNPAVPVEDAIREFFTFPTAPGVMMAVETSGASIIATAAEGDEAEETAAFDKVCSALYERVVMNANPMNSSSGASSSQRVLFVGSDGYPLASGNSTTNTTTTATAATPLLPSPPPAFAHLQATLGRSFADLLETTPQLYGALGAFNRYANRGLVRYLLLRGYALVALGHTSAAAAALARALATTGGAKDDSDDAAAAAAAALFQKHIASLWNFEGHWMEMAMPQRTVCIAAASESGGNSGGSGWLGLLQKDDDSGSSSSGSGSSGVAVRGPTGNAWAVVRAAQADTPESIAERVVAALKL